MVRYSAEARGLISSESKVSGRNFLERFGDLSELRKCRVAVEISCCAFAFFCLPRFGARDLEQWRYASEAPHRRGP